MATKTRRKLTFHDRLSRLTYISACRLLGPDGAALIREGSKYDAVDFDHDVYLGGDLFRLKLPDYGPDRGQVIVSITMTTEARKRLHFECSACDTTCEHIGAAFSLILEEKTPLGLAEPPVESLPWEVLSESQLIERALAERAERAKVEKFRLKSTDPNKPWVDYLITSAASGKSYRVAMRGEEPGVSYCTCPDFRTNTLGTCKHVLYTAGRIRQRFPAAKRAKAYRRKEACVHVRYGEDVTLHLRLPDTPDDEAVKIAGRLTDGPINDASKLVRCIGKLENAGHTVTVYPDAEQQIDQLLFQARMKSMVDEIRADPAGHPLRTELLRSPLLPYQLDGIAFAVGAGRSILADDMGLGKTIQAVGVAELLARKAGVKKVLVVCPASVKSQWRSEIHRFSSRDVQVVLGRADERLTQYDNECFYTICNYEQVMRDVVEVEKVRWDLIILDEAQRIKNWETKTARIMKSLKSPFAMALSGTPLENRLDDLFSVVQFIDDRRLAPAFRFINRHRMVDENGRVLGYKNLDELRENLKPILLRRTRKSVLSQLPPRTTEIVRVPPTEEQAAIHDGAMRLVSMIVRKPYLTEMDMLRLQQNLLKCRMVADSTFLVDKETPAHSSKLDRFEQLAEQLFAEPDRKTLIFSEWTTMLNMIEPILERLGVDFVRLDGSVAQKKRQQLVHHFQNSDTCRVFLATNAGATGLNLQAANTVINLDLPWNPAVLEQRIGRAHRMGQKNPVQVYLMVTEETLEERLLATLSAKHELSLAVLDTTSEVSEVEMISGMEELRRRLEVLLGAEPEAALDESVKADVEQEAAGIEHHRERVAAAGGEMLGAVFHFLGELVTEEGGDTTAPAEHIVSDVRERLGQCVEEDESGRARLTVTLPNRESLDGLAKTLARLLVVGKD